LQISGAHEPINYVPRETSIWKFNQLAHAHTEQLHLPPERQTLALELNE
jgi:hypothetical protein